ncbi:CT620/CT621 family type III secretion system effector [Chlamydiifrater volucris]|uniref:CT620/CT621 family type III secretion system effector n=1 Tax=Chlamydiifrater volucris TaxID=2681470 RepID=UPI001BD16319|nr:CT620/CT621 family type III secretion system effector [Chlamydiifrater volucris]
MTNSDSISSDYKDFSFERITRKNVSKESYRINNLTSMEIISGKKIALTKILHLASDFSNQINKQDNFDRCFSHSLISEQYSPETIRLPEKFQKAFVLKYSLKSHDSCLPPIKSSWMEKSQILFSDELVENLAQNEAREALGANKSVLEECTTKITSEELLKKLQEIISLVDELQNKEEPYSQQDILNIWDLSLQTANTICRMGLPAAETLSFIERLKTYNQEDSLKKIFSRERLEKMLSILMEIRDALSEENFQPFGELFDKLGELETEQDYSEEQIEVILNNSYELVNLITSSKLSQNSKVKYNRHLGDLFEYQIELLKIFQKLGDCELALENQLLNTFQETVQQVEGLVSIFAPVNLSSNLDTFAALEASSALQKLLLINSLFKNLKEEQKNIINQGLAGLNGLASYLGGVWAYFLASTVTHLNPDATEEEIGNKILEELRATKNFGINLVTKVEKTIQSIVENKGKLLIAESGVTHFVVYKRHLDPLSQGASDYLSNDNPVEINYQFMNRGEGAFLGSFAKAAQEQKSTITAAYKTFKSLSETSEQQSTEEMSREEASRESLRKLEFSSYRENSQIRISELKSLALPSSIASVLIDHYMPKEVDFLEGLYKKLYYSNLGSSVGNDILNAIPGYINSGTFFNFASFVGQQPVVGIKDENTFPGTKESAENRLKSEKEAAQKLLEQTRDGLEAINTQTKLVNEDSKISQEQRAYLTGLLVGYETSLGTIASNLITISNFLDQITISDGGQGKAGTFKVEGPVNWRDNLKALEEAVVSGLPSEGTRGGMFNVQALIQSDQQSFADMGQTYQLNLQMHLTSMQQEWTVVATSLQVLNQIYLGLARSLLR